MYTSLYIKTESGDGLKVEREKRDILIINAELTLEMTEEVAEELLYKLKRQLRGGGNNDN
ncbi:MAG: hypothetical protein PWP27_171 [Clostridiales bacterium]|jgi:hypothetical protein|nr:hypothetical protein [Clostridiales bacterium]